LLRYLVEDRVLVVEELASTKLYLYVVGNSALRPAVSIPANAATSEDIVATRSGLELPIIH
jgi:hypothetical protein